MPVSSGAESAGHNAAEKEYGELTLQSASLPSVCTQSDVDPDLFQLKIKAAQIRIPLLVRVVHSCSQSVHLSAVGNCPSNVSLLLLCPPQYSIFYVIDRFHFRFSPSRGNDLAAVPSGVRERRTENAAQKRPLETVCKNRFAKLNR